MPKYIHHDDPEPWLIKLREEMVFCGCYEGDIDGVWESSVEEGEKADYTLDYETYQIQLKMGCGQQDLVELIRTEIKNAKL